MTRAGLVILFCAASAQRAGGAVVTYLVSPTDIDPDANGIYTVAPGATIDYELYVLVESGSLSDAPNTPPPATPDNNGLSFFSVDILTDFGVQQFPLDGFSLLIVQNFFTTPLLGTPTGDDILSISAGQAQFATTAVSGIGQGSFQLLGGGQLRTPNRIGSFTVQIGPNSRANVLSLGSEQAEIFPDPGLTIRTLSASPPDGNGDGNGSGDGDGDGGGTPEPPVINIPTLEIPPIGLEQGAVLGIAILAAILGAAVLAGPTGVLIALVVAPLLAILSILAGAGAA
jgi:hypothetical protein